jgi:hypothetical protein
MAEGGMTQIMPQGNSFSKVLIKIQCPSDSPGDLGYFKGMGQTGDVMITLGSDEDLGLMF